MRLFTILIICAGLAACAYSYSKIDASNWALITLSYQNQPIHLNIPGGFFREEHPYQSDSVQGLIGLHYDRLSGPNIYGNPRGETRVYIRVNKPQFADMNEYIERNAEIPCDRFIGDPEHQHCVEQEARWSSYEGTARRNWHLFYRNPANRDFASYKYVKLLATGVFLEYEGVIDGPAYTNERTREQRIQLIKDIFSRLKTGLNHE